ncbi:hypothetical protein [Pontibacter pamirensis]|uniref:hypothetical protein n=1 Tax=Pontibacter pamirensis TaxID=2562824 RepID=UPI0013893C16|nr:hypothetical protein [Pontibacter pamirensis]
MNFDFYLGGYFRDHSYRLVLDNDVLRISDYVGLPMPEHEMIVSVDDNKAWNELVGFLESCDWKKRNDSEVLDGTQWELIAKGKGSKISSFGSNAYPTDFDVFLALLNSVVNAVGVKITK